MTSTLNKAIKQVLKEIDQFLTHTLKDQILNKIAQKERTKLIDSLQKLYNDFTDLKPSAEKDDTRSGTANPKLSSLVSQSSEDGECNDNIPQTNVSALKHPTKIGYLLQRKIGGDKKLFKQKKDPKKYCVIHEHVMYWFLKPLDKTYHGAIFLNGCEVRDMSRKEKEFVFQIDFISGNRNFEFQADNKEDLEEWKRAVEKGIKCGEEKAADGVDGDSAFYDDAVSMAAAVTAVKIGADETQDHEDELYCDPDSVPSAATGRGFKTAQELRSSIPRNAPPSPPRKDVVQLPTKGKLPKEQKPAKNKNIGKEKINKSPFSKNSSDNTTTSSKPQLFTDVKLRSVPSLPVAHMPTAGADVDEYDDGTIYDVVEPASNNNDNSYQNTPAAAGSNTLQRPYAPKLPQRNQNVYANDPDNDNLVYELG